MIGCYQMLIFSNSLSVWALMSLHTMIRHEYCSNSHKSCCRHERSFTCFQCGSVSVSLSCTSLWRDKDRATGVMTTHHDNISYTSLMMISWHYSYCFSLCIILEIWLSFISHCIIRFVLIFRHIHVIHRLVHIVG